MKRRSAALFLSLLTILAVQLPARGLREVQKAAALPAVAVPATPAPVKMDSTPLKLTVLHVNDTHAKLESAFVEFNVSIDDKLKNKRTFVELGGFARLWTAVDKLRAQYPNNLFLHAGDAFQGTLFFTEFAGKADQDFLNAMKLDAMAVGNHEFDKGPPTLVDFAEGAKFPMLACNLDMKAEPALAAVLKPYAIKEIGGSRVAIIGVANPDTPFISSPGPNVKFLDPVPAVEAAVKEVTALGINKIIVLSHIGYDSDKALAGKVNGIDIIIGGHSHYLLGPMSSLGLKPIGDYPTMTVSPAGDKVLVATAWQWANGIGVLDVSFDAAGKIAAFQGQPKLLAGQDKLRVYDLPDADGKNKRVEFSRQADGSIAVKELVGSAYTGEPTAGARSNYLSALQKLADTYAADSRFIFVSDKAEGVAKLATYSPKIDALKKKVATVTTEELKRGNDQGPGPIIADSMIWKTGADIAIMNPGGVRVDLPSGEISVAKVYELQPFANTLMTMDLSGEEVVKVVEDMCDFCITSYTPNTAATAYVYLSGAKIALKIKNAKGDRVKDVQVKGKDGAWKAIDPKATYKVVVNNFMGTGGDKNITLGALPATRRYDTGFVDSEAMLDYVLGKTLSAPTEKRVNNEM